MALWRTPAGILAAALILSGCSTASDVGDFLWPSLEGDEPAAPEVVEAPAEIPAQPTAPQQAPAPYGGPQAAPPAPAPTAQPQFRPPPPVQNTVPVQLPEVTPGQPTGTFVGQKIQQLRNDLTSMQAAIRAHGNELARVRNNIGQNSQAYHGIAAAIRARLQAGTTPGNPILVRQWNEVQQQLDRILSDVAQLNSLSNRAAADAGLAAFLLESTRAAYGLAGAVEEDHRQLGILEDEVNKTVVSADRVLNELSEEIRRQTDYVSRERQNLQVLSLAIKNGELYGSSLANRAFGQGGMDSSLASAEPSLGSFSQGPTRRPLVVVRFDREDVEYKQALYTAVSRALERRAGASFDVVAVAPAIGNTADLARGSNSARRYAERVARALVDMGLPADRVNLSASTSTETASNEVHVYVR